MGSPHKGPITRKIFPFDDVILGSLIQYAGFTRELDRLMTVMHANITFMARFPRYIIIRVGYLYDYSYLGYAFADLLGRKRHHPISPSGAETVIFPEDKVHARAFDAMSPSDPRSLATVVFTV